MEGYCVRCRAQREIKNGKLATKGVCLTCGASMYRIGASK
jgi:hypothetical protein